MRYPSEFLTGSRPLLLLLIVICLLGQSSVGFAIPLFSVDREQDLLVTVETTTGAVAVVGPLGVDAGGVGLAMLDGVLYAKSTFFNDHVDILTINQNSGAATSVVLATYNGSAIRNAEGFAAVGGELLIGFSTSGSISNSNAIGRVAPNGEITLLFDYSAFDPQADADGLVGLPDGRLLWGDLEFPGTGDFLRLIDCGLPPQPAYDELAFHTPLVASADMAFIDGDLWGIDFVADRLVKIHPTTGALLGFVPLDAGYDLFGLAPTGGESTRELVLDILPAQCPNLVSGPSSRPIHMAILGSSGLDTSNIKRSSLRIANGSGPLTVGQRDLAALPQGDECACTDQRTDGYRDLDMRFRKSDVLESLQFSGPGDYLLTVFGELKDGTPFTATDCLELGSTARGKRIGLVVLSRDLPGRSSIAFDLDTPSQVTLGVYDVAGRLVENLIRGEKGVGRHVVTWDDSKQSSGIYFYRFEANGMVETKKTLVIR